MDQGLHLAGTTIPHCHGIRTSPRRSASSQKHEIKQRPGFQDVSKSKSRSAMAMEFPPRPQSHKPAKAPLNNASSKTAKKKRTMHIPHGEPESVNHPELGGKSLGTARQNAATWDGSKSIGAQPVLPQYDREAYEDRVNGAGKIPKQQHNILKKREDAAMRIQKWYRLHSLRNSNHMAIQSVLKKKREQVHGNMEKEYLKKHRTEDEKRRQRREREAEERRRAMQAVRKSRLTKTKEGEAIIQKELSKVEHEVMTKTGIPTAESVEDKIDSIFKETRVAGTESKSKALDDHNNTHQNDCPGSPGDEVTAEGTQPEGTARKDILESLLETIKHLEAEPEELSKAESRSMLDEKLAWIDAMQSNHNADTYSEKRSSVRSNSSSKGSDTKVNRSSSFTEAKLTDFLADEKERESDVSGASKSLYSHFLEKNTTQSGEALLAQSEEAEQAASEITKEVLRLRLEVDEKGRSVELLKKALSQQRELTIRHAKEQDKELNQRLKMQKEQYESTIQRHLSFIDQLIDDKKVLGEKCERLVLDIKQTENKYQKKSRELQETHTVELKKVRDTLSATEKLRRDKWIEEKTKLIKEMTVKGLEPEIQRLIAKHKQEVKKLKALHEAELMHSDERAGQRYIRQTEELREQLEREKDDACTRERELARTRYENQLQQEEKSLQQQRHRMYTEIADEKERLNQLAARQRADVDKLKEQLEKNSMISSNNLAEEFKKSEEEAERRHIVEIETLKEQLELQKQAWQETQIKKQEAHMLSKERELKEAVRRERDTEIETVIEQLEKDVNTQRDQIQKNADNRIKRIREKYESELKEVETLERQTNEKYKSMKMQYSDLESDNMRLQSSIAQKEQEVADIKGIKNKLVEERGRLTDVIREEFAERIVHIEEENKRMKTQIAEMKARHKLELDRIQQEKEEELAEVHKRVKTAVVKKEDAISHFQKQYDAAVKRADHLEGLLESQRQLLAGKVKK